jgi:hypothetical protein
MALRMVTLVRAKDGSWSARKGIPEDVRDPYARLFGVRREAHLRLPRDTPHHDAKTRCAEWIADVETRIATLRAESNGEGQPLTKLNAIALAGRWYTWFVGQHENDPGSAKRWHEMSDHLVWNVIYPEAPDSYHKNPKADPHWEWQKEPDIYDLYNRHLRITVRLLVTCVINRRWACQGFRPSSQNNCSGTDRITDILQAP